MIAYLNGVSAIEAYYGESFSANLTLLDDGGTPIDISGYASVEALVYTKATKRNTPGSPVATLTAASLGTNGVCVISEDPLVSFTPGDYQLFIKATDGASVITISSVVPEITVK